MIVVDLFLFLFFSTFSSFLLPFFFTVTASMITFLWFIFSESLGKLNWWIRFKSGCWP
jgi:hypothetical protein